MTFFLSIIGAMFVGDVLWLIWSLRKLRRVKAARLWQMMMTLFVVAQVAGMAWLLMYRMGHAPHPPPGFLGASIYIWHILILPLTAVGLFVALMGWTLVAVGRCICVARQRPHPPLTIAFDSVTDVQPEKAPLATRRQMLAGMASAIPPLIAMGATGVGLNQLNNFRVRKMRLSIPTLPLALEGL